MTRPGVTDLSVHDLLLNKAYPQGESFSSCIGDYFIWCNIGDEDKKAITTALGDNLNFPVRHIIKISVQSSDVRPNRF